MTDLEKVGVSERRRQAENVVSFGMFRNGLHNGSIDDDQVFGSRLDGSSFSRVAGIKQQRRALQTDPIAFPTAFAGQFHLVLFPQ